MSNKMNDIFTEHLPELIAHSGDRKELGKQVRKLIKDSGGVRAITNPDSIIRSLTKTILEAMLTTLALSIFFSRKTTKIFIANSTMTRI